jgi:hypothetical protein
MFLLIDYLLERKHSTNEVRAFEELHQNVKVTALRRTLYF